MQLLEKATLPPAQSPARFGSVLVMDDDARALQVLNVVLNAIGAREVCEASSAEQALEILRTRSFDLILADYRMEGMDGVAFIEKLRASGDETPILIVSGAPDKAGVIRAAHHSRVDFRGKPFRVAELQEAMEKLVNG